MLRKKKEDGLDGSMVWVFAIRPNYSSAQLIIGTVVCSLACRRRGTQNCGGTFSSAGLRMRVEVEASSRGCSASHEFFCRVM